MAYRTSAIIGMWGEIISPVTNANHSNDLLSLRKVFSFRFMLACLLAHINDYMTYVVGFLPELLYFLLKCPFLWGFTRVPRPSTGDLLLPVFLFCPTFVESCDNALNVLRNVPAC